LQKKEKYYEPGFITAMRLLLRRTLLALNKHQLWLPIFGKCCHDGSALLTIVRNCETSVAREDAMKNLCWVNNFYNHASVI